MPKGVKIRLNWPAVQDGLVLAAFGAGAACIIATVIGIMKGLPWPPPDEGYLIGIAFLFTLVFLCGIISNVYRDFTAAWQEARKVDPIPQAPPEAPYRVRRISGRRPARSAVAGPTGNPSAPPATLARRRRRRYG